MRRADWAAERTNGFDWPRAKQLHSRTSCVIDWDQIGALFQGLVKPTLTLRPVDREWDGRLQGFINDSKVTIKSYLIIQFHLKIIIFRPIVIWLPKLAWKICHQLITSEIRSSKTKKATDKKWPDFTSR
jgi:hypothetical protein